MLFILQTIDSLLPGRCHLFKWNRGFIISEGGSVNSEIMALDERNTQKYDLITLIINWRELEKLYIFLMPYAYEYEYKFF